MRKEEEIQEEKSLPVPPQEPPAPICPHCSANPARVLGRPFRMGPAILMTLMCADCAKILTIFPFGYDEQVAQREAPMVQLIN